MKTNSKLRILVGVGLLAIIAPTLPADEKCQFLAAFIGLGLIQPCCPKGELNRVWIA